jgi:hypothetical protein
MSRLTDAWESSQPQHLRRLTIVPDSTIKNNRTQYCYRTFDNFDNANKTEVAAWDAVLSEKNNLEEFKRDVDRDGWGFPVLSRQPFVNGDGEATLSRCYSATKISPFNLTTSDLLLTESPGCKPLVRWPSDNTVYGQDGLLRRLETPDKPGRRLGSFKQSSMLGVPNGKTDHSTEPMIKGIPAKEYHIRYRAQRLLQIESQERLPQITRYATWLATQEAIREARERMKSGGVSSLINNNLPPSTRLDHGADSKSNPPKKRKADAIESPNHIMSTRKRNTVSNLHATSDMDKSIVQKPSYPVSPLSEATVSGLLKDQDAQLLDSTPAERETDEALDNLENEAPIHRRTYTALKQPVLPSPDRIQDLIQALSDASISGVHINKPGSRNYGPKGTKVRGRSSLVLAFKFNWLENFEWFMASKSFARNDNPEAPGMHMDRGGHGTRALASYQNNSPVVQLPFAESSNISRASVQDSTPELSRQLPPSVEAEDRHNRLKHLPGVYLVPRRGRPPLIPRPSLILRFVHPGLRRLQHNQDSQDEVDSGSKPISPSQPGSALPRDSPEIGDRVLRNKRRSLQGTEHTAAEPTEVIPLSNILDNTELPEQLEHDRSNSKHQASSEHTQSSTTYQALEVPMAETRTRNPLRRTEQAKTRVKTLLKGGSERFKRAAMVLELVDKSGGVIGGESELLLALHAVQKQKKMTLSDRETLKLIIKNIVSQGKLRRLEYLFQDSKGNTVRKSLLCRPDVSIDDSVATTMIQNIKVVYPATFVPPQLGLTITGSMKPMISRHFARDENVTIVPSAGLLIPSDAQPWEVEHYQRKKRMAEARNAAFLDTIGSRKSRKRAQRGGSIYPKILSSKTFDPTKYDTAEDSMQDMLRVTKARADQIEEDIVELDIPGRAFFDSNMEQMKTTSWDGFELVDAAALPLARLDHAPEDQDIETPTRRRRVRIGGESRWDRVSFTTDGRDANDSIKSTLVQNGKALTRPGTKRSKSRNQPQEICEFLNETPDLYDTQWERQQISGFTLPFQAVHQPSGTYSTQYRTSCNARLELWVQPITFALLPPIMSTMSLDEIEELSEYSPSNEGAQRYKWFDLDVETPLDVVTPPLMKTRRRRPPRKAAKATDHNVENLATRRTSGNSLRSLAPLRSHLFVRSPPRSPPDAPEISLAQSNGRPPQKRRRLSKLPVEFVGGWPLEDDAEVIELQRTGYNVRLLHGEKEDGATLEFRNYTLNHTHEAVVIKNIPGQRVPRDPEAQPTLKRRKRKAAWLESGIGSEKTSRRGHAHREFTRSEKQNPDCVLTADITKRLVFACIVIRTLQAGPNVDEVSWSIVDKILGDYPNYTRVNFRNRWVWLLKNHSSEINLLQRSFRIAYPNACKAGILPEYDPDQSDTYDFGKVSEWAEKTIGTIGTGTFQLPADRKVLEKSFTLQIVERASQHKEFYGPSYSASRRRNAFAGMTFSVAEFIPASLKAPQQVPSRVDVARSWLRARLRTGDEVYPDSPGGIRIQKLDTQVLRLAFQDLEAQGLIAPRRGKYTVDNIRASDAFAKFFETMEVKTTDFQEAIGFKNRLDEHWSSNESAYAIPIGLSTGAVMALTELLAAKRLQMRTEIPAVSTSFTDPFPRLSIWGFGAIGYKAKTLDRKLYSWPNSVYKSESYVDGLPLKSTFSTTPVPLMESNRDPGFERLPFWVDVHGSLITDNWLKVLTVVLSLLSFRAGMTAQGIVEASGGLFELWEIQVLLKYLADVKAIEPVGQWGQSWKTAEWWWTIFEAEGTWRSSDMQITDGA